MGNKRPTDSFSWALSFAALSAAIASCIICTSAVAKNETDEELARSCRKTIASSTSALVKSTLGALDACHGKRDNGRIDLATDCNRPATALFSDKQRKALTAACPDGNLARVNYEVPDFIAALQLFMAVSVEVNGEDLQGNLDLTGKDAAKQTTLKENRACHKEIGKQRSKIINAILKTANKCQKSLDKTATVFGPLAAGCSVPVDTAAADRAIQKKCTRKNASAVEGATVGSCDDLPACVTTSAVNVGRYLAARTYQIRNPEPTPTPQPIATPTLGTPTSTPANTPSPTLAPTFTPPPSSTTQPPTATPTTMATPSSTATIPVPDALPTESGNLAPPVDPGVAASVFDATAFLYTGVNPIQTGVPADTIDANRVAVLRGLVRTRNGQPLPGVTITVLNHPEFGQTLTRANGVFDLAVNGGGQLTVAYDVTGFLPVQRQIDAPWRDYAVLPDVVMIALDAQVTNVDLTANVPMQVARGSTVSDGDGSRQATVLFPQGTHATMVFPNGGTQPISALNVRATEYTVGASGPNAMPGELPATSGFTYCVELSVDEAIAAGASEVRFDTPLPFYVENFLGFPVGMDVPLGSYDRMRGVWIPEDNGKVIKILDTAGGLATLDTDGDDLADSPATLAALAITDAERQQLATLYTAGQTIERMLIDHFSPHDPNMPIVPPPDAVFPPFDPEPDDPLDNPCKQAGNSVIECQNQILGESIGVVGTGFGLHYQSDRTAGYGAAYTLELPLSGATVPASAIGIELAIEVAGRRFESTFPAVPNQSTTFTWDGKDAYGRTLDGPQPVTVDTSFVYPAVYGRTSRFGATTEGVVTAVPSREQVKLRRVTPLFIGTFRAPSVGLGGWTLSPHHAYVPSTRVLFRGDGQRESAGGTDATGPIVTAVTALNGSCVGSPNGVPASQAKVCPAGVAVGPDGSVYVVNGVGADQRVRRVSPDGIISTVAGVGAANGSDGSNCFPPTGPCGDGGPATQAEFSGLFAVAVGPDDSLFVSEGTNVHRVRKVDPTTHTITTVAGTGIACPSTTSPCGDGGPGTQAQLEAVTSLAVGPDGAVYIADSGDNRIRRLGADGIITTVAGTGNACANGPSNTCGDGGPATQASLSQPQSIAVGRDGSIYITEGEARVRRVTPDGIIRTIAGLFTGNGALDDGLPPTQVRLTSPLVTVGADDTVYIADGDGRLRFFRPGGTIQTIAGSHNVFGNVGDDGPARRALGFFRRVAIGPDGSLYVGDEGNQRVRRIAPIADRFIAGELIVPSHDGSEIFAFTPAGQHKRTLDALTGAVRYQFAYDVAGRLVTITDRNGNVTTVERDGQGVPTGILGPFGRRTLLELDAAGHLSKVTSPANEAVQLGTTPSGVLASFTKPGGQTSTYAYDGLGRIISATDPAGKTKTLTRTGTNNDHTITLTSPLGRTTSYRTTRTSSGDFQLTTTDSAGAQSTLVIGQDGHWSSTGADGTTESLDEGPDPRWGMRAPIPASVTVKMPSGLTSTATETRTVTLASPGDVLHLATLTETRTVNGRVSTTTYDNASATFQRTSPTGVQKSLVFDAKGRAAQTQVGTLAATSFTYNAQGRVSTVTAGSGAGSRVTTLAYGTDGLLTSVTDPLARQVGFTRDAAGRMILQTLPTGRSIAAAYDANGRLTTLTPPERPSHTLSYDVRDELSAYTAPAVGAENRDTLFTYNADRQRTRIDRADGRVNTFQYDGAGRLSLVDLTSGQETYGYDSPGRLVSLDTTEGIGLAYDGRLVTGVTQSGAAPGSITQTYDADFRISERRVNGVDPIVAQYDGNGRPILVGALTLTRDVQTGLVSASALGGIGDSITRDAFGALATDVATFNGAPLYSTSYGRDARGRINTKSETIAGVTHDFAYTFDPDGWLTEVRQDGVLVATYGYDANGNRLSLTSTGGTKNATYDARDRLTSYGSATYANAASGERLSKTVGNQTTTYDYDGRGNLIGATLPDGTQLAYLLDGAGRRVAKQVDGTVEQGFLYQDLLRPVAELDGSGAVVTRFIYTNGRNAPAYLVKNGVTYGIVSDHLGSPRLVIDSATGQVVQHMDYDEFGRVTLDTNPGFQPFGFAGGLYDTDTRLVRFGARDYDAETGRWTSADPIGFGGGDPNLYHYVFGDPINGTDPRGLCETLFACRFYDHQDNAYLSGKISKEEYLENRTGDGVLYGSTAVIASALLSGALLELLAPEVATTVETTTAVTETEAITDAATLDTVSPASEAVSGEVCSADEALAEELEALQEANETRMAELMAEEVALEDIPLLNEELEIAIDQAVEEELAPRLISSLLSSLGL